MATWNAPTLRATGEIVTAAEWNDLLGPSGSLAWVKENLRVVKTPTGTIDGANKAFTLPSTPTSTVPVLIVTSFATLIEGDGTNGFTRSGTAITLGTAVAPPATGENIRAIYAEA